MEIVPSALPASLFDPRFRFTEDTHQYFFGDRELQGASAWIKEVKPHFDADGIAAKVARKRGVSVDEVLAEWADARQAGGDLGHGVHLAIENHLNGDPLPPLTPEQEKRFALFLKLMDGRLKGAVPLGQEVRMYSLKHGLAGTADVILRLPSGKVFIGDWKTNKRFRIDRDGFNALLPPFAHLVENEGNTYAIQLALYRILLAEHGLEVDGTFIAYLGPGASEPTVYFPPDLREHALRKLEG
jgi:hypothetical protein